MPKRKQPKRKSSAAPAISPRRLWWFRIIALTFVPLLLVGGLELGLRLVGFGYPTSFFLRSRIGDREFYVPNDRFGYRFFPPAIARTPVALRMPAEKPKNCFRIFLFGESAAQGDPDPTFGVGRYLEVLLRDRYPGTDFEVVCVAMTAINSNVILPIARECARHDGDLWIIYMGNNEMVGPYGASTVFGPPAPNLAVIRSSLALKATRIGQLIENIAGALGSKTAATKSWDGMKMFKDHQLRYDDPARLRAYENFSGNLESILHAARGAKVPVILSTVASNLKDCAPFASLHAANLDESGRANWEADYRAGIQQATNNNNATALIAFQKAAAIDSRFADLQYRIGGCELALSNRDDARRDFQLARDYDALAFRTDSRLNRIIRNAAEKHLQDGVHLMDAAQALNASSPDGISGQEFFYEHVHLNFAGNYRLATLFAGQVTSLLPAVVTSRDRGAWASAEECDRRLAVSDWDRYRVWQANYSRVSEPPFTDQINDVPRARMYMAKLEQISTRMTVDAQKRARTLYEEALARRPEDISLRGNFAQFLGDIGDFNGAAQEQQKVCDELPQSAPLYYKKGVLLVRAGESVAAAKEFSQALKLRADYVPALCELGVIYANQQRISKAGNCFTNVLKLNPGYVEAYLNLGFMEQNENRFEQAVVHYGEAAALQPDGPAAHFNRAIALASQHQREEAIKFFQIAIWMNPRFWQARYLLAVELAGADKADQAEAQLAEVVRLRPDFAKAHLNFGVALAKRRQWDEAAAEFRAVLKLNPTNELAHKHLETIQMLQSRSR